MVTKTQPQAQTSVTGPQTPESPELIECLQHAQANATIMYLNAKRYHWFTFGPLFRDVHLFWDEVAAAALAEIDPLGERIRMLGGDAISSPRELERWCTITIAEGKPNVRAMLEEALSNERTIIAEMRAGAKMADDHDDPGTNDLFSGLVQTHEKHAWFISEFLRADDGLVS